MKQTLVWPTSKHRKINPLHSEQRAHTKKCIDTFERKLIRKKRICNNYILFLGNQRVCSQPQIGGNCLAYFPRWWYNVRTNQCERFIYGGCGGNQNNFETETACQRRCQRSCKKNHRCIIVFSRL